MPKIALQYAVEGFSNLMNKINIENVSLNIKLLNSCFQLIELTLKLKNFATETNEKCYV